MLKIRMQRTGRINIPSYRVVVTEHTAAPQAGKFVELVGNYNPKGKVRNLKEDRIKYWMSVGAKPSDTVHNMLVSAGILNAKKINVLPAFVEKKVEAAVETSAPAGVTPAPDETPAEEVPEAETEPVAAVSAEHSDVPKEVPIE